MRNILLLAIFIIFIQVTFAQTKVDEYDRENLADCDEHARLYNFATELKNNPNSKGYLIIHKPINFKTGKFQRHFYGIKRVLTEFMGIKPERFQMIAGEERKEMRTEFWLVSDNEKVPDFQTFSLETKLKEPIIKKTLFDYQCIGCESAVIIDYFIFREGLEYFAEALKANPNSNALVVIGKNEFISKTREERKELTDNIIKVLVKNNQIQRNRVKIKFTSGDLAQFYIIPNKPN